MIRFSFASSSIQRYLLNNVVRGFSLVRNSFVIARSGSDEAISVVGLPRLRLAMTNRLALLDYTSLVQYREEHQNPVTVVAVLLNLPRDNAHTYRCSTITIAHREVQPFPFRVFMIKLIVRLQSDIAIAGHCPGKIAHGVQLRCPIHRHNQDEITLLT